jgi:hypothetical protein
VHATELEHDVERAAPTIKAVRVKARAVAIAVFDGTTFASVPTDGEQRNESGVFRAPLARVGHSSRAAPNAEYAPARPPLNSGTRRICVRILARR